jgi:hypothetical protein
MYSIFNAAECEVITPEPVPNMVGFYYYPKNKNIAISREGVFYSFITNRTYKRLKKSARRYVVRLYLNKDKRKVLKASRLIAYTFVGRHKSISQIPYDELEVNHIDGNPRNDLPNNLEWCTTSQNLMHARINNLIPTHGKEIMVKNLLTNEIKEFDNMISFIKSNNYSRKSFSMYTKTKNNIYKYMRYGSFIIKQQTDLAFPKLSMDSDSYIHNFYLKNIHTNEIKDFINLQQLADFLKIARTTLAGIIYNENNYIYRFDVWILKGKGKKWPNLDIKSLEYQYGYRSTIDIMVTKIEDNSSYIFNTLKEACIFSNLNYTKASTNISKNKFFSSKGYILTPFP